MKEKFEYELVQLNPSVQHLKVISFASSNEKPLYYWPLVVFLDDKGCILEGVSGFKSKSYPSTMLQHASIQGVLKVPPSAHLYYDDAFIFCRGCYRKRVNKSGTNSNFGITLK